MPAVSPSFSWWGHTSVWRGRWRYRAKHTQKDSLTGLKLGYSICVYVFCFLKTYDAFLCKQEVCRLNIPTSQTIITTQMWGRSYLVQLMASPSGQMKNVLIQYWLTIKVFFNTYVKSKYYVFFNQCIRPSDHELKRDDVIISRWQWGIYLSVERRTGKVHWLDGEQRDLTCWVGLKGVKWMWCSSAPYPEYWKQWRRKWRTVFTSCRTFSFVEKNFSEVSSSRPSGWWGEASAPPPVSPARWVRSAFNLLRCEPDEIWSQTAVFFSPLNLNLNSTLSFVAVWKFSD